MDPRVLRPRMCVWVNVQHGKTPWHRGVVIEAFGDEAFIVNASSKHHELIGIPIAPKELNPKSSSDRLKLDRHSYLYRRNHGPYRADCIRSAEGVCPQALFLELLDMVHPLVLQWQQERLVRNQQGPISSG